MTGFRIKSMPEEFAYFAVVLALFVSLVSIKDTRSAFSMFFMGNIINFVGYHLLLEIGEKES